MSRKNDPIEFARSKMVDLILAASFEDDTVDGKITELYLELDEQQRLEIVAALAVFSWREALRQWGDDQLAASLYVAQYRRKLP